MKKTLLIIVGILVVIILGGYLLPRELSVAQSVSINAPAANAFDEINDLEKWNHWSYWNDLYKDDMKIVYGDVKSGVNGWYAWEGEEAGKGKITITESVPDKSIKTDLDFMEQGTAQSWYTFEPEGEGTKLTMGFESDLGMNPFMRWIGTLFIKPEMDKAMKYNVTKLKEIAESKPRFTVKISEETLQPISYVGLTTSMSPKDPAAISAQMAKMYGELYTALTKSKVQMTGAPFSLYPKYTEESMDMVCALPVAGNAKVPAKYKIEKTPGGKAVKATHMGDYANLKDTHDQINLYITSKKLQSNGAPMEVYITDPMQVKDTAQWVTEIYYPVQ